MNYRIRDLAGLVRKPTSGVLTLLGLSSLGDGMIKWRNWFSSGVLQHYRVVRDWAFGWMPFSLPVDIKDYVVLWASCGFLAFWVLRDVDRRTDPESHDHIIKLALNSIVSLILGPIIVLSLLPLPSGPTGKAIRRASRSANPIDPVDSAMEQLRNIAADIPAQRKALLNAVLYLLVGGVVLLFVASDLIKTS